MIDFFQWLLSTVGAFFTLYGLFIFFVPMFKMKSPMDRSNIVNAITAPIYTAMHPSVFSGLKFFRNDIGDNIRMVEQAFLDDLEKKNKQ